MAGKHSIKSVNSNTEAMIPAMYEIRRSVQARLAAERITWAFPLQGRNSSGRHISTHQINRDITRKSPHSHKRKSLRQSSHIRPRAYSRSAAITLDFIKVRVLSFGALLIASAAVVIWSSQAVPSYALSNSAGTSTAVSSRVFSTSTNNISSTVSRNNYRSDLKTESISTANDGSWGTISNIDASKLTAEKPKPKPNPAPTITASPTKVSKSTTQASVPTTISTDKSDAGAAQTVANANHPTGDTGNAYPFSQCTWWAYVRRHQLGLPVGSYFGNGADWANSARALGYSVDNTPSVGAIMVFAGGQEGSSSTYGHVAIVEKIVNGAVVTSESGASLNGSTFSRTFTNTGDFQYIHG